MRVAVVGLGLYEGGDPPPGLPVDLSRLRRMDRFGRCGFLAGSLALTHAGVQPHGTADPRAGVVVGTAFGCRDSITDHDVLVRTVAKAEELSPAVFAQTVHNTVNGELAIAWRLGGISETLVSGLTGSLEALLVAARRVEQGDADLLVVVGAEGIHERMRHASPTPIREAGAALVLVRAPAVPPMGFIVSGLQLFEKDEERAEQRLVAWLASVGLEVPQSRVSPELLGAGGAVAVVEAFRSLAPGEKVVVVSRDPSGPLVAVLLER